MILDLNEWKTSLTHCSSGYDVFKVYYGKKYDTTTIYTSVRPGRQAGVLVDIVPGEGRRGEPRHPSGIHTAAQSQKAVNAYFLSKQLLHFGIADQHTPVTMSGSSEAGV